ncbi:MAG: glycosyltransferase family 2 protein [Acidobacteria bacterium]|nr:glycosyltransferase family 2 protein [Acidobacteriota bacterium]
MSNDGQLPNSLTTAPLVGVCVLNYHQAEATLDCIASLLAKEPPTTRILWIENDAEASKETLERALASAPFAWIDLSPGNALPEAGVVGVLRNAENLGYAGGNNAGLKLLHANGVPYAWVINNDTKLMQGSSADLVAAAQSRPEVGAWGTAIVTDMFAPYFGGVIRLNDYKPRRCEEVDELERDPMAFVSGCSLFLRTETAARTGFIPEDYFLYYEDPAFSFEVRKLGLGLSALETVRIWHHESLSTGDRSDLKAYYNARNRWTFIQRYFPGALHLQARRRWYRVQSLLFRGRLGHARMEWLAYRAFRRGEAGRNPAIRARRNT